MNLETLATFFGFAMALGHPIAAISILKHKRVDGISLPSFFLFFLGTAVWTLYGLQLKSLTIFVSFFPGFLGSLSVILLTLYYRYYAQPNTTH